MAKKIPMRQCVGCGEMKSKKEMMRVLKTADGEIVLDTTGRKNGRGAYLCFSEECLKKARKNHGLERSFKVSIPQEVYDRLEREYREDGSGNEQ
ncbi:MAG: YlxR family protein [Lachnospiraceae bacterium]|nr:YlxR family protein [Lachnospiraceae bacterium]